MGPIHPSVMAVWSADLDSSDLREISQKENRCDLDGTSLFSRGTTATLVLLWYLNINTSHRWEIPGVLFNKI